MRTRTLVESTSKAYIFGKEISRTMTDDISQPLARVNKRMNYVKCSTDNLTGGPASYSYKQGGVWVDGGSLATSQPLCAESNAFYERPSRGAYTIPPFPSAGFLTKDLAGFGKSKLNAPVMILELAKTLAMIQRPWKIAKLLASGKLRLPPVRSAKFAVGAASEYLGIRYGWKPFLADVRAIRGSAARFDAAKEFLDSGLPFQYKTSRENETSTTVAAPISAWQLATTLTTSSTLTAKRVEFCRAQKSASYETSSLARRVIDAYGGTDFAKVAWELVPYSFVVDWFLPVGDMIDQHLGSPAWFTAVSAPWYWERLRQRSRVLRLGASNSSYRTTVSWDYTVTLETFIRGPINVLPPKPIDIDGYQVADLLCLAGQSWGKLLGKRS